jgi:hypothetical protein
MMTKTDDWVRITLRLPPRLHARISKAAATNESSLNNQIIDLLYEGLEVDMETGIASLHPSEWPQALKRLQRANEMRFEALERAVTEVLAEDEAKKAQPKKDVA